MAFPSNPTNGQQTTQNGVIYTYSSALGAWTVGTNAGSNISANNITATGTITGASVVSTANLSAQGNVIGTYILGNGALLTGVITSVANINNGTSNVTVVSSGGNITVGIGGTGNVAVFATTGEYVTGVLSASGNIQGANILTAGLISATGNATAGNVLTAGIMSSTGNAVHGNILTAGLISATSTITSAANITGGNILTGGLISATGNATAGNVLTAGIMSSTGNAIHGNILTAGIMSSTGNAIHGNILTAGLVSATGNITAGNISVVGTVGVGTAPSTVNGITLGENVTGGTIGSGIRFQGAIQSDVTSVARGMISIPSVAAAAFTLNSLEHFAAYQGSFGAGATVTNQYGFRAASTIANATNNYGFYGDIASSANNYNLYMAGTANNYMAGNILTAGYISATGNVTGNYFLGNGSQLTGITTSANTIFNGNSNVTVGTANGNITVGVAGTSNVIVWANTGQYVTGIVSVSGNITSNGNVALGLTSANARLHVSGNIYATGDIVSSYSDERLKTRLGNIDNAVEKVLAIDTFYYEPNDTAITLGAEPGRQVGVSAQSVQQVQQETVTTSPLSSNYLTVKYERLVPLLIQAVKEQQKAIEQLQLEISKLKRT